MNTLDILTTCVSTALTPILPTTRAIRPIMENVTSSTNPEVHNILQCRQRRTEPRPQRLHVQKSSWSVSGQTERQIDRQTDKQTHRHTDTLIAILCTSTGGDVISSPHFVCEYVHTLLIADDQIRSRKTLKCLVDNAGLSKVETEQKDILWAGRKNGDLSQRSFDETCFNNVEVVALLKMKSVSGLHWIRWALSLALV